MLSDVLSLLITNRYSVSNSIEFTKSIKDVVIEEDETLVLLDVASIPTSVSTDRAVALVVETFPPNYIVQTDTHLPALLI